MHRISIMIVGNSITYQFVLVFLNVLIPGINSVATDHLSFFTHFVNLLKSKNKKCVARKISVWFVMKDLFTLRSLGD